MNTDFNAEARSYAEGTNFTDDNQDDKDDLDWGKSPFSSFPFVQLGCLPARKLRVSLHSSRLCVETAPKFSVEGRKIEDEQEDEGEEIRNQTGRAVFAFKPANDIFDT